MIALLDFLTGRSVIFALAMLGALIVMGADRLNRKVALRRPGWSTIGYIVTGCSIFLFVVAGFLNN